MRRRSASFTLDTKAKRLVVLTTPGEQEAIKAALDKLDAALPADLLPSFALALPTDRILLKRIKVSGTQFPNRHRRTIRHRTDDAA